MCFNYQINEKTSPAMSLSKPYAYLDLAFGKQPGDVRRDGR